MGRLSSVGVAQHLIRELVLAIPKWGAGLPPSRELRKDHPLPSNAAGTKLDFWSAYLDDVDVAHLG
eukprot:5959736-Lingulodinium_polyedra.AAC.1